MIDHVGNYLEIINAFINLSSHLLVQSHINWLKRLIDFPVRSAIRIFSWHPKGKITEMLGCCAELFGQMKFLADPHGEALSQRIAILVVQSLGSMKGGFLRPQIMKQQVEEK